MRSSALHLSPKHFYVYEFILKFKQTHGGNSPSVAEITQGCDLHSTSAVGPILHSLALFGMIKCNYGTGKSRMIEIPGTRWTPPLNSDLSSPVSQGEHVVSVSGSSIKS